LLLLEPPTNLKVIKIYPTTPCIDKEIKHDSFLHFNIHEVMKGASEAPDNISNEITY
jgi:hypothetical protein